MFEGKENIIYGRHPVMEAIESDKPLDKIYIKKGVQKAFFDKVKKEAAKNKIPFTAVDEATMKRICGPVNHQGILAFLSLRVYDEPKDIFQVAKDRGEDPFILVLNEVQDHQNLGSLLRSAEGAGVHGVIIGKHRSAQLSSVVSKVSAGADSRLKIARVTNIADTITMLKERGLFVVGTDSDGETRYYDYKTGGATAVVLGGEEKGLGSRVKQSCDLILQIPLSGKISSLNVGVAGGILMFHLKSLIQQNVKPK